MKTELALFQALISINVSEQKANAVIDALETDMLSRLATKAALTALAVELKAEISQLEAKLTIRFGIMLSTAVGVMITAMMLLH
ncbi:hypothetical protein GNF76_26825 [Pseudomonas sp. CCM 7893]|uniref:DUF1640 domain-containing protein n=1 Tax=Pseudomonas spelaei TaxID=1055469 RepID=A0A6I3WI97_9PSED|nr:hypothetical protein [Pseudomonas spelaei]MUF07961.1 hypothetical protein [Pseudomonas spelaei]